MAIFVWLVVWPLRQGFRIQGQLWSVTNQSPSVPNTQSVGYVGFFGLGIVILIWVDASNLRFWTLREKVFKTGVSEREPQAQGAV